MDRGRGWVLLTAGTCHMMAAQINCNYLVHAFRPRYPLSPCTPLHCSQLPLGKCQFQKCCGQLKMALDALVGVPLCVCVYRCVCEGVYVCLCVCACSCLCVLSPNHLHILCPDLHIYSILCFASDRRKSMKFCANLN